MRSSVCPALTTAAIVHGLSTDHDRRRGQRCTVLTHPVSLIHRGISVQMNRDTSLFVPHQHYASINVTAKDQLALLERLPQARKHWCINRLNFKIISSFIVTCLAQ